MTHPRAKGRFVRHTANWRKAADVVKGRPGATSHPQIANRPPPPVRGRVAAKRCEADDALVGTPPADAKLRRLREGRTARSKCSVDGTPRELRYLLR